MGARPFILVLAGVNGAGKSSVAGALLEEHGLTWFNPDTCARELVTQLGLTQEEANARAWHLGRERLETAIAQGSSYAFETTLGAKTIPSLLARAAASHDVIMIYCGLSSPEQHMARVQSRVERGGHHIPEAKIRERWIASRANLIQLLPKLRRLQVFDNSAEAATGEDIADPVLVLELNSGAPIFPQPNDQAALAATPPWARPIVQAAIELLG
ncbi:AAA family ATPase [Variovorax sp. W2I14]|uniref:AAA family ATPase n=1 Tax=Variovorax sp. W2I14 TaxID=3042290 RepID=UPI003D207438